jgi:hypothetical protein
MLQLRRHSIAKIAGFVQFFLLALKQLQPGRL